MKRSQGFNLLELMLALAMSAVLIDVISQSYFSALSNYVFNNSQLTLNQSISTALGRIKRDVAKAGVFGNYSMHNLCSNASSCTPNHYSYLPATSPGCATSEWCSLDTSTIGVRSDSTLSYFSQLVTSLTSEGITLKAGSEVLRVQYGGNKVAPFITNYSCNSSSNCSFIRCNTTGLIYLSKANFTNQGIDTSRKIVFLASANRGYLLNLAASPGASLPQLTQSSGVLQLDFRLDQVAGCPSSSSQYVLSESAFLVNPNNYWSYDPDSYSLELVNFYTRYYFVGSKNGISGLYEKTLAANGSLANAVLISDKVTNLKLDYQVIGNITKFNNYPSSNTTYSYLSTSQVTANNAWRQIIGVTISLTGKIQNLNSTSAAEINLVESDSVGWER